MKNLFKFGQKKYIAILLIQDQDSYEFSQAKRFNPFQKEIRFRTGLTKMIEDIKESSYKKGLKVYYFFDTHGRQLTFNQSNKELMTVGMLDKILAEKIIHQLTSNLTDTAIRMNIMILIIGGAIGGLLGYIIGYSV